MKNQASKKVVHICSCGRVIPPPFNSTIWPKICPSCDRIKRNKALLTRSHQSREKVARKGCNEAGGKKKSPKSLAMENADTWFSRFIRIKYHFRIVNGEVFCKDIITGVPYNARNLDNGHYYSRDYKTTRYEEDNCRPQNRSSNRFRGEADHEKFGDNLKKEIGEERFKRIEELHRLPGQDNIMFYNEMSDKYRKLTNKLVKQFDVKKWW